MLHAIKFDKENFFTCTDITNKVLETGLTEVLFVLTGKGEDRICQLLSFYSYDVNLIRLLLSCQYDGAIVVSLRYDKKDDILRGTIFNKENRTIQTYFPLLEILKNKSLRDLPTTIRAELFLDTRNYKAAE
jgi:hypothetical protein